MVSVAVSRPCAQSAVMGAPVAPSGDDDFPSESVSFNYGTIQWTIPSSVPTAAKEATAPEVRA